MTRRAWGAAVAAGLGVALLGGCADDGGGDADDDDSAEEQDDAAPPAVATSTTLALDDEGAELEALLEQQRELTIHLVYEATSGGDPYTLEVFRRDGRVRQETTTETEQGTFRTAGILADGQATICQQQPEDDWRCSISEADEGTADGIFGTVLDDLRGLDLARTEETIDGASATCFAYEGATGPGRVCVDERGVPLEVSTPEATLSLTSSDDDVPDSAFEPPAEPIVAPED